MPAIFQRFTRSGALGVDAFFVLSGFLITALLLREQATTGRIRVGRFYMRRALRLLPALLVFLGVHAVYAAVVDLPAGGERSSLLAVLLYYVNTDWRPAHVTDGIGHLWSLSVEEQFYIVWPLCVLLVAGLHRRAAVAIPAIVVGIAAVSVYRLVQWQDGADRIGLYQGTTTRADALLVGALLAHLWVRRLVPTSRAAWAAWPALGFFTCAVVRGVSDDFLFQGGRHARRNRRRNRHPGPGGVDRAVGGRVQLVTLPPRRAALLRHLHLAPRQLHSHAALRHRSAPLPEAGHRPGHHGRHLRCLLGARGAALPAVEAPTRQLAAGAGE